MILLCVFVSADRYIRRGKDPDIPQRLFDRLVEIGQDIIQRQTVFEYQHIDVDHGGAADIHCDIWYVAGDNIRRGDCLRQDRDRDRSPVGSD